MGNFNIALKITGGNEGDIANNPNDSGQFTYCGIASAYWPNWVGFPAVHKAISDNNGNIQKANLELANNPVVQQQVNEFYKQNFWDVNSLDQINDQQICNNCYDCGVNSGTGTAAKFLQRAVSVTDDGIIGSHTIAAVNGGNAQNIYENINGQRLEYYEQLAQKPGQAQFLSSWKSRLIPYKSN